MIGYTGGDDIYDQSGEALPQLHVKWLQSDDGLSWTGETVWTGGGSETDFTLTDDALVAVIRNEAGDEEGFGSKICRASLDTPTEWACTHDCRKFDSPLMFSHASRQLIARRNVTEDGCFDLGLEPETNSHSERFLNYTGSYWQTPKRCTLMSSRRIWRSVLSSICRAPVTPASRPSWVRTATTRSGTTPPTPMYPSLVARRAAGPTMITRQRLTFSP